MGQMSSVIKKKNGDNLLRICAHMVPNRCPTFLYNGFHFQIHGHFHYPPLQMQSSKLCVNQISTKNISLIIISHKISIHSYIMLWLPNINNELTIHIYNAYISFLTVVYLIAM